MRVDGSMLLVWVVAALSTLLAADPTPEELERLAGTAACQEVIQRLAESADPIPQRLLLIPVESDPSRLHTSIMAAELSKRFEVILADPDDFGAFAYSKFRGEAGELPNPDGEWSRLAIAYAVDALLIGKVTHLAREQDGVGVALDLVLWDARAGRVSWVGSTTGRAKPATASPRSLFAVDRVRAEGSGYAIYLSPRSESSSSVVGATLGGGVASTPEVPGTIAISPLSGVETSQLPVQETERIGVRTWVAATAVPVGLMLGLGVGLLLTKKKWTGWGVRAANLAAWLETHLREEEVLMEQTLRCLSRSKYSLKSARQVTLERGERETAESIEASLQAIDQMTGELQVATRLKEVRRYMQGRAGGKQMDRLLDTEKRVQALVCELTAEVEGLAGAGGTIDPNRIPGTKRRVGELAYRVQSLMDDVVGCMVEWFIASFRPGELDHLEREAKLGFEELVRKLRSIEGPAKATLLKDKGTAGSGGVDPGTESAREREAFTRRTVRGMIDEALMNRIGTPLGPLPQEADEAFQEAINKLTDSLSAFVGRERVWSQEKCSEPAGEIEQLRDELERLRSELRVRERATMATRAGEKGTRVHTRRVLGKHASIGPEATEFRSRFRLMEEIQKYNVTLQKRPGEGD